MATIKVFERIKEVREEEKNQAYEAYRRSVDHFEEVASELYQLLKDKEKAQAKCQAQLQTSLEINSLRDNYHYMEKINLNIDKIQHVVHMAREEMNFQQEKLSEAYVEVKKFSEVIEKRMEKQVEKEKLEEMKLMDELSVRQYMNNEDR